MSGIPDTTPDGDRDLGPVEALADGEFADSKFFAEALTRLVTGRDMNIVITASSETGVGKSTLAYALALLLDQHGWTADRCAIGSAREYDSMYDDAPPGSVVILDEAEKAVDSRRGMTSESVSLTQSFASKRYKQVFSILTAPTKGWIDKRLGSDSADYWIQAQDTDLGRVKGEAKVYRLKTNEHYEREYTERTETISWPDVSDHPEFQRMDEIKQRRLEGDADGGYVSESDVESIKEQTAEEAREAYRKDIITKLNDIDDLTQEQIGNVFDIHRSRVSHIVNNRDD